MFDVAVIGGGIAGLVAATFAGRSGRSVLLLEKGPQPGGRATTHNADGFYFNQGPHAIYRSGEGGGVLRELGVTYRGARASSEGSWAMREGEIFPLPRTPESFMAAELLSEDSRREAVALFGSLDQLPVADWARVPLREWLDAHIRHTDLRQHFEALIRLSTYGNDPVRQSAGAALEQMIVGGGGVDYLDGGWQSLVDALHEAAQAAGVRIETRSAVEQIQCGDDSGEIRLANGERFSARTVISTVAPSAVARLVNGGDVPSLRKWSSDSVPIYAACLDVALRRLPQPEHQFAIGLDRPLYYSVQTRSARLAPGNAAVIQLAKYLPTDAANEEAKVEGELEALLDTLQAGWRKELVTKRFLPRMRVANAIVTAVGGGMAGRPGAAVPELPNLFVAGDWVGSHGMLVDASLASARQAAMLALQSLEGRLSPDASPEALAAID